MSQAEAFVPHLGEVFLEHGMTGQVRERRGNSHPAMAPHGVYPCQGEDRWVAIAVRGQAEWLALCEIIGAPRLATDPRFATLEARLGNRTELDDELSRWTVQRDRHQVAELLQTRGIPAGPVLDCGADAYDDPHLQSRGYFQTVAHPDSGTHLLSGPIWKRASESAPLHGAAPMLGEHNGRVLGELLGFPPERLGALERADVIGSVPLEGADMGGVRRFRRQQS
jgi:crotonobetainyl-CoA:carnitine CoA-transferase CaiB-like acyl-CoA transferase